MKIQIIRPFSADKEVGEVEQHYGVSFTVEETNSKRSVLTADLDDEEAQAMIDAGRAEAVDEAADLDDEEAQDGQPAKRRGRKPKAE